MDVVPQQPSLSINARRVKTDLLTSENIFIQTNNHNSLYGSTTLYKSRSPIENNSRISPPTKQSRLKPPLDNRATLPTGRGTRLLNRSRIHGSDSPRSLDPIPRPRRSSSLTPSPLQANSKSTTTATTDDLTINRSARNAMIQDVLYFKKQLLRLRRLLQEDEDILKRTDTLNPFDLLNGDISSTHENNNSRLLSSYQNMESNSQSVSAGPDENMNQETEAISIDSNNHRGLSNAEEANNNNNHELIDLKRQLVYLQSQIDENSRTIRIQKNLITKYETEKQSQTTTQNGTKKTQVQHSTVATQTERIRPTSQSRLSGISTRIESNGHSRPRSNGHQSTTNGKQLINGGLEMEISQNKSLRTNDIGNVLLQTNNRKNLSSIPPQRGQIYSKKSMDNLLNIKNLSVSPPTKFCTSSPISRISLKYSRPSLASSTNSLSSLNQSVASSTSSLSDHNNSSKSCLKIEPNY